jgi:hypothetical protein
LPATIPISVSTEMVIVDDHLALLAIAGELRDLGIAGPVVTTWSFQFRMARAVADSSRSGSLSRRVADPTAASRRVLHPPAHRLVVLDPRSTIDDAIRVAVVHSANLLLAELVGAAVHHGAAIRVTRGNQGRTWAPVMQSESIDFAAVNI